MLSQMVQNNLPPTYQLYARLASLCAEMKNYEQAQAILEAMTSNGLVPGILSFLFFYSLLLLSSIISFPFFSFLVFLTDNR